MLKRIFILILCVFLTGCSHKDNKITIKFSTWGSASEMKILAPIISNYEKENPNVRIELLHIPQDYFKKLHLLFASNLAPDVVFINNLNLPVYAKFFENLDNYIDKSTYYEQALSSMKDGGELLAIPRDVSTLVIYYNKTMLKKYNISPPRQNWSMEDMIALSKKLTQKNCWGISYEPKVFYTIPYLQYFGEDVYNMNKNSKGLTLYKDLAYKYNIAPTVAQTGSKTLAQMFLEGKIAMHLGGRWMVPKYREAADFEWDVVNFPQNTTPCDASGWAVVKTSKNKTEAIKFVMYLSNKENISKMTSDGLIVPARKDVAESSVFLNGKPKHSKIFTEAVKKSQPTKVTKTYNKLVDQLNATMY